MGNATYKGTKVTTREITKEDKGFDPNLAKVVIVKNDGSEEAVPKSEVTPA
jgi:hypothetical protein